MLKILKNVLIGTLSAFLIFCGGWFGHAFYTNRKTDATPKPALTLAPIIKPQLSPNGDNQVIVIMNRNGTAMAIKLNQADGDQVKAFLARLAVLKHKTVPKILRPGQTVEPMPVAAQDKKEPAAELKPDSEVTSTPAPVSALAAVPLDNTLPAKGQIAAKFMNRKDNTGDLSAQTRPLAGTVKVTGDLSNSKGSTLAINPPKPTPKVWTAGAYYERYSGGGGFLYYGQRSFPLTINNQYTLTPYVEMELGIAKELIGGISFPINVTKTCSFNTYGEVELGNSNEYLIGGEFHW